MASSADEFREMKRKRLSKAANKQIHHIEPTYDSMTKRDRLSAEGAMPDEHKLKAAAQKKLEKMDEEAARRETSRLRTSNLHN